MPTYTYVCHRCDLESERTLIPIDERNNQKCDNCNLTLHRTIMFEGSVWAPTAGGMR